MAKPISTSAPRSSPVKGSEPELDELGDVAETNSGGFDGVVPDGVEPGPLDAVVGAEVVVTPPTAPLGVVGLLADAPATAPGVEQDEGRLLPRQTDGGVLLEQVADDVLLHGVQLVVVVLVHGGGVQLVVLVLVHGGGVQLVVVVLVHGGGWVPVLQPV